LVPYRTCKIYL